MPLTPERLQDAYRQMLVIRKFEEAIRSLYQQGKIRGSFHPCVGQEATAVGGCWAVRKDDYMTCTYRGHGQAIAKGLERTRRHGRNAGQGHRLFQRQRRLDAFY